jgi:hypothetical protein
MASQQLTMPARAAVQMITRRIYVVREKKVMLDRDLAELYDVPTKAFNQAIKRNRTRLPVDFMFQLSAQEAANLRSQFVTSSPSRHGGRRYRPFVFTQEGVAMLSSILRSQRAVQVNIAVMRAFVSLREMAVSYANLARKLGALEKRCDTHDHHIRLVFDTRKRFIQEPARPRHRVGFVSQDRPVIS